MAIRNAWRFVAVVVANPLFATGSSAQEPLSPADIEALRALDQQQVQDWISGDREAILESLTEDAVFIPHHGVTPKSGAELEEFWWPDDAPPFRIVDYWHKITRIEGEAITASSMAGKISYSTGAMIGIRLARETISFLPKKCAANGR
ncbi:MAG: hypothetical protein ACREVN_04110 [Gammaproteobacteria bacterium]